MKKLKFLLVVLLSLTLLVSPMVSLAESPYYIHDIHSRSVVTRGVVHTNLHRFTKEGWQNINILEIDLKDNTISIDTIFSERGISKRDTLSTMVKSSGAIAAINGDFFNTAVNSSPLGPVVQGGNLVTAPYTGMNMASFYLNKSNVPFIDFFQREAAIYSKDTQKTFNIAGANKEVGDYSRIMYFDKYWGTNSPGSTEKVPNMVELVVINDKVVEIRQGMESVEIPKDGFVLSATGEGAKFLLDNFKVGSGIYPYLTLTPNLWSISSAIGGGAVLVREGKVVQTFNHNISGRNPRTAVGYKKDKSKLYMVTVDGRQNSSIGMTQTELAEFMVHYLGLWEAINLDGGGSTTMITRLPGLSSPRVVNHIIGGSERAISNGLGVFSNAPKGSLSHIQISLTDSKVFNNTSREVRILGFDQYHNPIDVDMTKVNLSVSGVSGSFDNNFFLPTSQGQGKITARIGNITATTDITVLDKPVIIEAQPSVVKLNYDELIRLSAYGVDKDGHRAYINPRDLKWSASENLGTMESGVFKAGKRSGSTLVELSLDGAKTHIGITVGYRREFISRFIVLPGIFVSHPSTVTGNFQLDNRIKYTGMTSGRLDYDFTNATGTRAAYIGLDGDKGRQLSPGASKISMQVYGNNSNHWLRANIIDATGKSHNIDFERYINWEGWKEVTAVIPSNIPQPVTLKRIYIVETDELNTGSGSIYFDSLELLSHIDFDLEIPQGAGFVDYRNVKSTSLKANFTAAGDTGQRKTLLDNVIANKVQQLSELSTRSLSMTSTAFNFTETNGVSLISLDTSKGGIRLSNQNQWHLLKTSIEKTQGNNIIVSTSTPVRGDNGFTDPLELNLFHDILRDTGKNVFVVSPSSSEQNSIEVIDGIRYFNLSPLTGHLDQEISLDKYTYLEIYLDNQNNMTYSFRMLFE